MDEDLKAKAIEHQQNIDCATGIKKLIGDNFDGYRLDTDKILATAMNVFGEKRVELALASSIEQLSYDGRITTDNKNWAHSVMVAQDERNRDIRIDVHPLQIEMLTGDFRKLQKSLGERALKLELSEHEWQPVLESEDENGKYSTYFTQIEGRYFWISEVDESRYDVETDFGEGIGIKPLSDDYKGFSSRSSAEDYFNDFIDLWLEEHGKNQLAERAQQQDVITITEADYSVDGFIDYCEGLKKVHEEALENAHYGIMMNYEEGFVYGASAGLELARQLKNESKDYITENISGSKKITIDALIDVFSKQSSKEFLENEPSQFNYGHTTAMSLCLSYAKNLKAVLKQAEHTERQDKTFAYEVGYSAPQESAENIPQTQDISHNTINAVPSAIRAKTNAELSAAKANGQKRSNIMNNTKLSVSSMTIPGDESSVKAYATVTVNDEFAIKNLKVIEGKNGLFVTMPSRKSGNEYSDVVFPITKEAREQLNNTIIDCYNDMQSKGQEQFMNENTPPEKSTSNITASVHLQDYENSKTKAVGQIVIDGAFVVSGVKVVEGKDKDGNDNLFASMPSYTNDVDERKDFAFPITKECYEKVQNAVLEDFNYIQNYHEMGGKENLTTAYDLSAGFADKLSAELRKNGIENIVKKNNGRANISVRITDKEKFTEIRKDLAQSLQQERNGGKKSLSQRIEKAKSQQPEKSSEQTQKQPHRKPNSQEI